MAEESDAFTDDIALFDVQVLIDLVDAIGEDKALAIYAQAPETIQKLCQAVIASGGAEPDYREMLSQIHNMKGVAGNLGYLALHALCDVIVSQLRNEEFQMAQENTMLIPEMVELTLAAAVEAAQNI